MGWKAVRDLNSPAWAGLSDHTFRVATKLAWAVRDNSTSTIDANVYWGGHTYLAQLVAGRDDVTEWEIKKIQHAVRELKQAGALQVLTPACRNQPPAYRLTLNEPPLACG